MDYINRLKKLSDKEYATFQAKLTPNLNIKNVLGVRVPDVRNLAKQIIKEGNYESFLHDLPHKYYDENMLHGVLISLIKDYDECVNYLEEFLPYVDNWAVCDIMSPACFKKHKDTLICKIKQWCKSKHTYTIRFSVEMLMSHFLDEDFKKEYLQIPGKCVNDEYYVKMMVAWFYATALAKKWDDTIEYIKEDKLDVWTHNKTIQKARESYRITPSQKEYLLSLKR